MHDRDAVAEERAVHSDRLRSECDLRDKDDRAAPRLKNAVDHRLDNESLSASRDPVKERGGGCGSVGEFAQRMYRARLLVGIFRDGRCGGRGCRRQVRIAEDLPLLRSDKPLLFERGGGGTRLGDHLFQLGERLFAVEKLPEKLLLPFAAQGVFPFAVHRALRLGTVCGKTENRFVLYVRRLVILPAADYRALCGKLCKHRLNAAPELRVQRIRGHGRILTHKGVNGCGLRRNGSILLSREVNFGYVRQRRRREHGLYRIAESAERACAHEMRKREKLRCERCGIYHGGDVFEPRRAFGDIAAVGDLSAVSCAAAVG